jgi:hypothetical protein
VAGEVDEGPQPCETTNATITPTAERRRDTLENEFFIRVLRQESENIPWFGPTWSLSEPRVLKESSFGLNLFR